MEEKAYKPYSHPRWRDVPMAFDAACSGCIHYKGGWICEAFPGGIPRELLLSVEVRHDKPYPGDGGYLFTPKVRSAKVAVA